MNSALMDSACRYINKYIEDFPRIAIILGSGLKDLAEELENPHFLDYNNIPGFVSSTAPGHVSRIVWGELAGVPIILLQGRFHLYEGYSSENVSFPIKVLSQLGTKILIFTNAAGGVNRAFKPGDLMLIHDHINFSGKNPLIGMKSEFPRSPLLRRDKFYSSRLTDFMKQAAENQKVKLKNGTYAWMCGPSFESASEIRMLRILGADAVGMSTVPEVITAVHSGLEVVAISCISNMAAGILDQPITSEEVIEAGLEVKSRLSALIKEFINVWQGDGSHVSYK